MNVWTSRLCATSLALLAATHACADEPVSITLAHDNAVEQQTRQRLVELLAHHDVSRWTFTRKIVIDQEDFPHSHPVLTLHVRHRDDDELKAWELMHFWAEDHDTWLCRAVLADPRAIGAVAREFHLLPG